MYKNHGVFCVKYLIERWRTLVSLYYSFLDLRTTLSTLFEFNLIFVHSKMPQYWVYLTLMIFDDNLRQFVQVLRGYDARQTNKPPLFLATASRASRIPCSVEMNIDSPSRSPSITPPFTLAGKPRVSLAKACIFVVISLCGLLITLMLFSTGFPSQYFIPIHNLVVATFRFVTGSGTADIICSRVGGVGPAR